MLPNKRIMDKIAETAGMAAVLTASTPLEVIKTRLQTQRELLRLGTITSPYHSAIHCLKAMAKSEGPFALWRGAGVGVARFFPNEAINYYVRNELHRITPDGTTSSIAVAVAGGWTACALLYPL